jgi:uncharacterized membrane protein
MKNAWLNYVLIRLGLFIGILAIMLILGFDPFFSALIAAMLSLAISLVFFNKHRNALSEAVYNRLQKKSDADTEAEDVGDAENK